MWVLLIVGPKWKLFRGSMDQISLKCLGTHPWMKKIKRKMIK